MFHIKRNTEVSHIKICDSKYRLKVPKKSTMLQNLNTDILPQVWYSDLCKLCFESKMMFKILYKIA